MQESKSCALPLGYTPLSIPAQMAGVVGFEPTQCWSQSPMPYRLATPHRTKRINGVIEGDRTLDLQSHNLAFSQLNYDHHIGAPRRIRTFDLCLRRALLYPAELWKLSGAGEGNRTLATSLEGWGSTTELHLHIAVSV